MKILRIMFHNVKISLLNELSHKANFLMRFLSDSVFFIVYFIFYTVIYSYVSNINGWGKYEILLLMGTFHIVISLFTAFFVPNLAQIPGLVKSGGLDRFLVKPVNTQFLLSARTIDIGSLVNIVLGIAIVCISFFQLHVPVDAGKIILYVVYIGIGVLTLYSVLFILICTIFWLSDSSWSIRFFMTFNSFADKPISIYKGVMYRFLVYIFPIGLVANVPANILLDKDNDTYGFWLALAAISLFLLSKRIWKKGIELYEGASI